METMVYGQPKEGNILELRFDTAKIVIEIPHADEIAERIAQGNSFAVKAEIITPK